MDLFSIAYNWSSPKIMTFFLHLLFSCFLRDCCNVISIWSQFRPREPTKYLSFCENSAFLPSFLLLCRILSRVLSSAKHCPVQFQCNLKMQKKHPHYGPDPPQLPNVQRAPKLKFLQRKCELCPVAKHKS